MMESVEILSKNLQNLSEGDRKFAESMLTQLLSKGRLSDKQWYWVKELAKRAKSGHKPAEVVHIGDLSEIHNLFDKAGKKLRHPAVILVLPDHTEVRLSQAGAKSAYPGSISVSEAVDRKYARWFGRIYNNRFVPTRRHVQQPKGLVELLQKFAANPAKVASEFGKMTGRCCFCNRGLEDERSVEVGYGPVCAEHYGLPWGNKPGKKGKAA